MLLEEHPLSNETNWIFLKPEVGVRVNYLTRPVGIDKPKETAHSISTFSSCREVIIGSIRTALQNLTTKKIPVGTSTWQKELKTTSDIILNDKRSNGLKNNYLTISTNGFQFNNFPTKKSTDNLKFGKIKLEEFLRVSDIVVGLPAALLNPNRMPGDWWHTNPEKARRGARIYWNGIDNTILQHPVITSTLTGLYRQAYCLCFGGFGPEVLKSGSYEEVQEAIDSGDWKEIFAQCEKFRPWINVPVPEAGLGKGGNIHNFAFPWYKPRTGRVSFWQRFVRFQRALRRHGFEEVLGQDISTGWNLLKKEISYSGVYTFWGEERQLTKSHKRVMELGKPLKRKTDVERSEEIP